MTIDTRDVNDFGPGKFRTSVNNREEQVCYFKRNKSDTHFTSFSALHTQAEPIRFSIDKANSTLILSIKALTSMLKVQCLMESLRDNFNKLVQKTLTMEDPRIKNEPTATNYMTTLQSQPTYSSNNEVDYSEEKSQDFSQQKSESSKIVNRHRIKYTATRIKYSPTRIKSRNFLSNISYTGINKSDFYNENFILDVYVLLVKNLNPFSLSRNISDKTKHEMVYTLWRECIPTEFYIHICKDRNFIYLNGQDVSQPGVLEIVGGFIDQGKQNLRMLQEALARYKDIYQYVYSHVFPAVIFTSCSKRIATSR